MTYYADIDGLKIPIKIIQEYRQGARVSLGGKSVILRVPRVPILGSQVSKHLDWATNWLKELKVKKPHVLDKYLDIKLYAHGDLWKIGGEVFILNIQKEDRSTGYIKMGDNDMLLLKIPQKEGYDVQKLIKSLLIKFAQGYFLPKIVEKVNYYNQCFIKKPINGVKLKYNTSNWGSCSTGKNLNFSVRLLFAPDDVIDYVVVHELAHLHEMNHSDRFWDIVRGIMPDYEKKEEYLKLNGGKMDF